jgi:beta-hydroxyacyl-ACP dehydratase FabZ
MSPQEPRAGSATAPEQRAGRTGDLDIGWILRVLPHRYPLLLVDRVEELVPGERIVAIKNVTINEPFFLGHFPGHPVVPGVLLVEGLAQAGGLLVLAERADRDGKLLYFAGIDKARFRRPVIPGDQIRYEVEVLRLRATHCRLEGRVLVRGKVAAEALISSAMVDRQA